MLDEDGKETWAQEDKREEVEKGPQTREPTSCVVPSSITTSHALYGSLCSPSIGSRYLYKLCRWTNLGLENGTIAKTRVPRSLDNIDFISLLLDEAPSLGQCKVWTTVDGTVCGGGAKEEGRTCRTKCRMAVPWGSFIIIRLALNSIRRTKWTS